MNKSKTVVRVAGKGHINSIVYALIFDQGDFRFQDLVDREHHLIHGLAHSLSAW